MNLSPRPYLVVPKLIEQPTWGGQYIINAKQWITRPRLGTLRIGQSYELFSGSNLSLLESSEDLRFEGELTNNVDVEIPTKPEDTISLRDLTATAPSAILGKEVVEKRGERLQLLIKFTQALGNSFQVHIKANTHHPKWKPKPESWYYFEPGLITLGVKPDIKWTEYEHSTRVIEHEMRRLGERVKVGTLTYEKARIATQELLKTYNPWQYVNLVPVAKDELIDLSSGGIHHSWEEDPTRAPLGNVLIELQVEAMDTISTFRSFDKGKLGEDGAVRPVHIDEYFDVIDRSVEANKPKNHTRHPIRLKETQDYTYDHLIDTPFYNLDKLTLQRQDGYYEENLDRYKHIFLKSGRVVIIANNYSVTLTTAHSCFIPANTKKFRVESLSETSELLISY